MSQLAIPVKINSDITLPFEKLFNELRKIEFSRLDKSGHTYLDYTGGGLYSDSQLFRHHELLRSSVLGNPHSSNPSSMHATHLVEEARQKVIDFFNAKDYHCIFTQNATGALKIVGECYPFQQKGFYLPITDNHNSVNGIREYCQTKGGEYEYAPLNPENLRIDESQLRSLLRSKSNFTNKLFAYPAQSNVSGVKHSLDWIHEAQSKGWDVLLDAAAYVPTSKLDLSVYQPEFVCLSFYKMFGYPTGIGCLLVKKSKFNKLQKPWFAGGTVTLASVMANSHFCNNTHERFENGTISYANIPAVKTGLEFLELIGMNRISNRIEGLRNYLYQALSKLRHSTGRALIHILGPSDSNDVGGTLSMSFFDKDGCKLPFEMIEEAANTKGISIRSGCFCNPGADETANQLSPDALKSYFNNRSEGNYTDMISQLGIKRGAIRVSVGIATTKQDLDVFIGFAKRYLQ